jgi:hypothetical protein
MQITTMNVVQERTMKTALKSRIVVALLAATIVTVGMAVVPALVATPGTTTSPVVSAHATLSVKTTPAEPTKAALSAAQYLTPAAYA